MTYVALLVGFICLLPVTHLDPGTRYIRSPVQQGQADANLVQNKPLKYPKLGEMCNNSHTKYSAIMCTDDLISKLQNYVIEHIWQSYKYLLLATRFNSYTDDRDGFEKLYRKLSDESWEDAVKMVQYMAKRGIYLDLTKTIGDKTNVHVFDVSELGSLHLVLGLQKHIAQLAHQIHAFVIKHHNDQNDAEVASFIEEEFVHKHAKTIRALAGHYNDLKNMIEDETTANTATNADKLDSELAIYVFDQYLKKLY